MDVGRPSLVSLGTLMDVGRPSLPRYKIYEDCRRYTRNKIILTEIVIHTTLRAIADLHIGGPDA